MIALLLQNGAENLTAAESRFELWGNLSLSDPLFLLALPLAWLALWYGRGRRGSVKGRVPAVPARLGSPSLAQRLGFVPVLLQALALSLVVLALARPLRGDVRMTSVSEGVDIAVVVDRSSSMTLQDLDYEGRVDRGRTRLEVVQQVVADFATRRMTDREGNADRVAVFSFARYPQILCPFTLDADAVRGFVSSIEPATGNTPEDGTAIGMALAKAVAVLRVTEYRQLTATASLESGDITTIHAGDLAVLAKRSPETVQIGVRVDGSVPPMTRAAFEASLSERSGAARQVVISDATDAFSLERPPKGGLLLRGPEGTVRDRVDQPYEAADSLVLHARQRALMALSGEGGQFLVDGESLEIWLTPHEEQPFACSGEPWVQACPGEEQVLPLCTRWAIHVRNRSGSNLRVGGAVLWNDGQMLPLPEEGREVLLGPGQQDTLFNAELVTTPPLEALEHVVVVGTNHRERINWQALASAADSRAGSSMRTRPWTVSHLDMRVTANPRLEPPPLRIWRGGEGRDVGQVGACVASEPAAITAAASALYLEPYLPSVSTAPLARVLEAAHGISLRAESIPSTIDGATAIRAAFAEAGVAYTGGDAASLTKPVGPDRFEGCLDAPPATGDLWVHDRDGDVSATLVLDPSRSVAWDGQGYRRVDGAPVACWRHSDFVGPGARGGEREVPMCWDRAETCCATPEACEGW